MRSAKKQRRGEYAGPHRTLLGLTFTLNEMGRGMRTLIDLLKSLFKWGRQGGQRGAAAKAKREDGSWSWGWGGAEPVRNGLIWVVCVEGRASKAS